MIHPAVRVRRATPGDVDVFATAIATRLAPGGAPSAERIQYAFSLIVTEPMVEVYVAERDRQLAGFATVYYLEYLTRGGLSAIVTEVLTMEADPSDVARALLDRVRAAAIARHCRHVDLHLTSGQAHLAAAAEQLGFTASAQGLSLFLA